MLENSLIAPLQQKEVPPCLQLRGCRCSPDLEAPGTQLLACSSAPAQVSEPQEAQE